MLLQYEKCYSSIDNIWMQDHGYSLYNVNLVWKEWYGQFIAGLIKFVLFTTWKI
jgi:hypothetical protein